VMFEQPIFGGLDGDLERLARHKASRDDPSGTSDQASCGMSRTTAVTTDHNNSVWRFDGQRTLRSSGEMAQYLLPIRYGRELRVKGKHLSRDTRCGLLPRRFPDILAAHHRHLLALRQELRTTASHPNSEDTMIGTP